MLAEQTDEEIIASYKAGDGDAFKGLIDRYATALYNFTARIGGRNDAADIVQEVFIKVWKNINRFDEQKASFKTWLFTIARNTTTDFLRKKKSLLFSDIEDSSSEDSFLESLPDEDMLPDEAMQILEDKTEGEEFLNEVLDKLNPTYREILVLHYQEEMTFDEIGKILNKPLNTVKSGHRRAILELRKRLN